MDDKEFMQYTGLKDKNGTEINVGDPIISNDDLGLADEWELQDESGQQRLDALGGTFWLSNDDGDCCNLVKVTVDAAGPNESNPVKFATELRAKNWVEYLIEKENQK